MDTVGEGHFPISMSCADNNCAIDHFYTADASINHRHIFDVPSTPTSNNSHNHGNTAFASGLSTSTENNEPPWHGLVKIIRIK